MSGLVEKLTAEGSGESAEFLNDIVKLLWPNINAAGSKMVKEIVEPMFKTMLPGPLATLHFTKIDLGPVPLRVSNAKTTKTEEDGIKLDLNVDWVGKADIEMDADMIPALGVESVQLHGRLSILLCPLTNIIPLIGAAQISFINPPVLKLDFTGAANVADFSIIDDTVRKVILGIINSMFTLPNRFLLKLDASADYFKIYQYPVGMVRVTVEKAWGFGEEAKSSARKLFSKLTRAAPDCYAKVDVGGEESWKTATKNNTSRPAWNETHDFVVSDLDQCIKVAVEDEDVNGDDEVGLAVTTVREILVAGGSQELTLVHKGEETEGRVSISCEFFKYVADAGSLTASDHKGDGRLSGIATILVASASGIKGQREDLKPSVVVTWGKTQRFQTAIKTDAPGTDISNPAFDQAFRLPITTDLVGSSPDNFRIALLDGEKEIGGVDIPFERVADAPDKTLQQKFDIGNGATVRASIRLRGIVPGEMPQVALADRRK
ncbi:hypothetical protein, variant 2 [Exophiala xenobiotica]|uniref:C2 domain-containing protein n=2 Tax=Exophiala xenobiotica TaxID=348802 RepID=A0A0D2EYF1_9EURO|nr:hypothetical protein, variant 1 [Exophiala xenobiotica]XP_013321355.1 hypothetical protein, variant 2 [Exophiala xenobiotica]XP_013321356.1 uncharacterized protein PV05_00960 [Exophiala xenobiotica]KIW60768.1 hypothetical protein PV05_00960 [Exophiala xenobiotica]KIW60769.1 hypothetical protein, variant 1 [Exophiala xenobiotica]KIW60770.1 hypothetical protein, variant 2 [Exophiala xenobiotica]